MRIPTHKTLYTLARKDKGSERWVTISTLVDESEFLRRLYQDGVERDVATEFAVRADELTRVEWENHYSAAHSVAVEAGGVGWQGDRYRVALTRIIAPGVDRDDYACLPA